jgi:hypothetical protein
MRQAASMARSRPGRYRRVLLAGTWLVGGGVAVAVGFAAVALISDEVTERSAAPLSRRAVEAALTGQASTSPPAPRSGRGANSVDAATPIPSLSATRPAPPTGSGQPSGPATPVTSSGPPGPSATASPARPRPGSYQLRGGRVVVVCTGSVITLRYAVPADGYRSEVDSSPTTVEVEFAGQGHHSRLSATCRNGEPVEQIDEGGDDSSAGDHFTGAAIPR